MIWPTEKNTNVFFNVVSILLTLLGKRKHNIILLKSIDLIKDGQPDAVQVLWDERAICISIGVLSVLC